MKHPSKKLLLAALTIFVGGSLNAQDLLFKLSDHPDGNQAPPTYGLRLDGLFDGNKNTEVTFTFDHADSAMFLDYTEATGEINIYGKAFGGVDTGTEYAPGAKIWDIDFTYTSVINESGPSDLSLVVFGETGSGSISSGSESYSLTPKSDGSFAFRFNDTDDHRLSGYAGYENALVGWGWLTHQITGQSDRDHLKSSDWLFTATPIPEPATVAMLGILILALGLHHVRKRKNQLA